MITCGSGCCATTGWVSSQFSQGWCTAAVDLILSKRLKVSGAGREGGGNGERSETASELLLAVLLSAAAMGAKGDCASARRPHG